MANEKSTFGKSSVGVPGSAGIPKSDSIKSFKEASPLKKAEAPSNINKGNPYYHGPDVLHKLEDSSAPSKSNPYYHGPNVLSKPEDDPLYRGRDVIPTDRQQKRDIRDAIEDVVAEIPKNKWSEYGITGTHKKELEKKAEEIIKIIPDKLTPGRHERREYKLAIRNQERKVSGDRTFGHNKSLKEDNRLLKLVKRLGRKKP